jgi:hypothetical protein
MNYTNRELVQLMKELHISCVEVAKHLCVPVGLVTRWTASDGNEDQALMPPSYLHLLKYSMMTENRRTHLF